MKWSWSECTWSVNETFRCSNRTISWGNREPVLMSFRSRVLGKRHESGIMTTYARVYCSGKERYWKSITALDVCFVSNNSIIARKSLCRLHASVKRVNANGDGEPETAALLFPFTCKRLRADLVSLCVDANLYDVPNWHLCRLKDNDDFTTLCFVAGWITNAGAWKAVLSCPV